MNTYVTVDYWDYVSFYKKQNMNKMDILPLAELWN